MAPKKIAQTVLTEGKFYTISAANGKVVEVADYNIDNGAKIQLMDNANFEWQQWNLIDLYGNVPIVTDFKDTSLPQQSLAKRSLTLL